MVPLVYLCACFQVFDGSQVVGLGILRGMGDVRCHSSFFGGILVDWHAASFFLAFTMGYGVPGIWMGPPHLPLSLSVWCSDYHWWRRGVRSYTADEPTWVDIQRRISSSGSCLLAVERLQIHRHRSIVLTKQSNNRFVREQLMGVL